MIEVDFIDDFEFRSCSENDVFLAPGSPPPNQALDRFLGKCSQQVPIPQKEPVCLPRVQDHTESEEDNSTSEEETYIASIDRIKDNLEAAGLINIPLLRQQKARCEAMCVGCGAGPLLEYRKFEGQDHFLCRHCAPYLRTLSQLCIKIPKKRPRRPKSSSPPPLSPKTSSSLPPLLTSLINPPAPSSQPVSSFSNWDWLTNVPSSSSSDPPPPTSTGASPSLFAPQSLPAAPFLSSRACEWCKDPIPKGSRRIVRLPTQDHFLCDACGAHYRRGRAKEEAFLCTKKPRGVWTRAVLDRRVVVPSLKKQKTHSQQECPQRSAHQPPTTTTTPKKSAPLTPAPRIIDLATEEDDTEHTPLLPPLASITPQSRIIPSPPSAPQQPWVNYVSSGHSSSMGVRLAPLKSLLPSKQLSSVSPGHQGIVSTTDKVPFPISSVVSVQITTSSSWPSAPAKPSTPAPVIAPVPTQCQFCRRKGVTTLRVDTLDLCHSCAIIQKKRASHAEATCEWCLTLNVDHKPDFWRGITSGVHLCPCCFACFRKDLTKEEARKRVRKSRGIWTAVSK